MHDLNEVKVQPVGIIADNAKNFQSAKISKCCQIAMRAQIIDLIIQKALTTVGPLSTANDTFVRAIEKDKISRYAETRWNRIQKMIELQKLLKKKQIARMRR